MRRPSLFLISAFAVSVLAAAAYADTSSPPTAPGWMMSQMETSYAAQLPSEAQSMVGLTVSQMMTDMGTTNLRIPLSNGGSAYFYEFDVGRAASGPYQARVWIDVDSGGKVTGATVS